MGWTIAVVRSSSHVYFSQGKSEEGQNSEVRDSHSLLGMLLCKINSSILSSKTHAQEYEYFILKIPN